MLFVRSFPSSRGCGRKLCLQMVDGREIEELRALAIASIPAKQKQKQKEPRDFGIPAVKRRRLSDDKEEGEILSDEEAASISRKTSQSQATSALQSGMFDKATLSGGKPETCLQAAVDTHAVVGISNSHLANSVMLKSQRSNELNASKVSRLHSRSKEVAESWLSKPSLPVKGFEDKAAPQHPSNVPTSLPGLASGRSSCSSPTSNVLKEADTFLAGLNIPVASNAPIVSGVGSDRNSSLVITFSDNDSDSDSGLPSQPKRKIENRNWVANGVQSGKSNPTAEGLRSQIDNMKKQIAALQSTKRKAAISKVAKISATSAKHINAKYNHSQVANSQMAPSGIENLRKQISEKENELQHSKQRNSKESLINDFLPLENEGISRAQGPATKEGVVEQQVSREPTSSIAFVSRNVVVKKQRTTKESDGQSGELPNDADLLSNPLWGNMESSRTERMLSVSINSSTACTSIPENKSMNTSSQEHLHHLEQLEEHKVDDSQVLVGTDPERHVSSRELDNNVPEPVDGFSSPKLKSVNTGRISGTAKKHVMHVKSSNVPKRKLDELNHSYRSSASASVMDRMKKHHTKCSMDEMQLQNSFACDTASTISRDLNGDILIDPSSFHAPIKLDISKETNTQIFLEPNSNPCNKIPKDAVERVLSITKASLTAEDHWLDPQMEIACNGGRKVDFVDLEFQQGTHNQEPVVEEYKDCNDISVNPLSSTCRAVVEKSSDLPGNNTFSSLCKAIIEKCSDKTLNHDNIQGALVDANKKVPPWCLEKQLQSFAVPPFYGFSEKSLEFGPDVLRQMQEEEECVDKELEEAQQNRRKCEVRERYARKHYRDAQEALDSANIRCDMLYQKREMLAMRIRAAPIQNFSNKLSVSSPVQSDEMSLPFPTPSCFPGRTSLGIELCTTRINDFERSVTLPSSLVVVEKDRELERGKEPHLISSLHVPGERDPESTGGKVPHVAPSMPNLESSDLHQQALNTSIHEAGDCYEIEKEFHHGFSSASFAIDLQRNNKSKLKAGENDGNMVFMAGGKKAESLQGELTIPQDKRSFPFKELCTALKSGVTNALEGKKERCEAEVGDSKKHLEINDVQSWTASVPQFDYQQDEQLGPGGIQAFESCARPFFNNRGMDKEIWFTVPSCRMKAVFSYGFESLVPDLEEVVVSTPLFQDNVVVPVKYHSPLCASQCHKCCKQLSNAVGDLSTESTWTHKIDPLKVLCKYEHRGRCNNIDCIWQHKRDYEPVPDQLQQYIVSDKVGRGTEMPDATRSDSLQSGRTGGIQMSIHQKSCCISWGLYLMNVSAYFIGSHMVNIERCLSPLFASNCRSLSGFCQSISVGLPVHRFMPAETACLLNSSRPQAHIPGHDQFLISNWEQVEDKGHYSSSLDDVDSILVTALNFIDFNLNAIEPQARKNALYVLSRGLEAKPSSVILWVVYLHLFYRREKNIGADDMFYHAVCHNKGSYDLWLMFINSRMCLMERLEAYESAITALGSTENQGSHQKEKSSFLLDLALQMLNCMCHSTLTQEAISWIKELTLLASEGVQHVKKSAWSSRAALLISLTAHDLCILWVCCAYVVLQLRLPDFAIGSLGCKQQLPFFDVWQGTEGRKSHCDLAMKILHVAASDGQGCLALYYSDVPLEKDAQLAKEAMMVNIVQSTAICEGTDGALMLANKFFSLYPCSVELILLRARLVRHIKGELAGLDLFEEALQGWPVNEAGKQRLWHQYTGYTLEIKGVQHAKTVLARSAAELHNISGNSLCEVFCSSFGPKQSITHASYSVSVRGDRMNCPELSEGDRNECVRQAFHLVPSLLKQQRMKIPGNVKQVLSETDTVFAFLNLAVYEALNKDSRAAITAAYSGLNVAVGIDDVQHCLREIATLTCSGTVKTTLNPLMRKSFLGLLDRCFIESQLLTAIRPLYKGVSKKIKHQRARAFVDCLMGSLSIDYSLLNDVLESIYGPTLLPGDSMTLRELTDFIEKILEVIPNNYKLAVSASRVIKSRVSSFNRIAQSAALFWCASLLVDSMWQASPAASESVWVEAGEVLASLGFDILLEDYYQYALIAYPFSTALWNELLSASRRTGNRVSVLESAEKRGIKLLLDFPD